MNEIIATRAAGWNYFLGLAIGWSIGILLGFCLMYSGQRKRRKAMLTKRRQRKRRKPSKG